MYQRACSSFMDAAAFLEVSNRMSSHDQHLLQPTVYYSLLEGFPSVCLAPNQLINYLIIYKRHFINSFFYFMTFKFKEGGFKLVATCSIKVPKKMMTKFIKQDCSPYKCHFHSFGRFLVLFFLQMNYILGYMVSQGSPAILIQFCISQ